MNLFDLFAKITLDSSDYEESLKDAENATSSFSSSIGGGIKKAAKVGAVAVGAVAATTTAMGKKIYDSAKATANYGDAVDKMSQKVGMSAEAYQKWDYVLNISGTEMASMTTGLKTLTNKFDDARNGSKSAVETFEKLGLSMESFDGMSREEVFSEVISAFQGMEDSAERAALANDLFGKSGQDLAPLLNTSREETEKLKKEAVEYGAVMSNDAVKQSATFNDRLTRMNAAMGGVKKTISASFLPGLTTIVEGFADVIAGNEGANDALSEGFDKTVEAAANNIPKLLEVGSRIVTSLSSAIIKNLPKLAKSGLDMILNFGKYVISSLPKLADAAVQIVSEIANGVSDALPELMPKAAEAIVAIVNGLANNSGKLIEGAGKVFSGLAQGLVKAVPVIVKEIPNIINTLVREVSQNASVLLPAAGLVAGKSILTGIIGGMKDNALLGELKSTMTGKGGIVAAVVGGVVLLLEGANKEIRAAYSTAKEEASKLTDSQQAVIDKIHEEAEKWGEIKEKRKDIGKDIDETVGHYKELWDRLQEIVDAQGNVKEGYEEEAKTITGELSEALGIEIGIVDGQIQKYDELKKNIEEVITKKKAELMLKALEDDYAAAIKNRSEARTRLLEAEKGFNEALGEQESAEKELIAAQNRLNEAKAYGAGYTQLYGKSMVELEKEVAEAQGKFDGATEKLETFSTAIEESKTDLKEAATTMTDYDDILEATATGSVSEMNRAMDIMTNSIKTAKNATKDELKEQTDAFYDEYAKQVEAVKNGGGAAAKEAQAEAKKLLDLSVQELAKLDDKTANEIRAAIRAANGLKPKWFELGKDMAAGLASGLEKSGYLVVRAGEKISKDAITASKKQLLIGSPSKVFRDEIGFMMGKGLALGMEDADDLIQKAAENWVDISQDDGFSDGYEVSTVDVGGGESNAESGNVTINVYGAAGQDINALAEEVAVRFQRIYTRGTRKYA